NRPLGRLAAADRMELVCDGYDDGGSVHALHGPRQFARQYIATARGQGPEHTNAGDIDRGSRGYARAWHDWPICRPHRAFDRLAADCGLDTRRAERRGSGSVNLAKNQSRERRQLRRLDPTQPVARSLALIRTPNLDPRFG